MVYPNFNRYAHLRQCELSFGVPRQFSGSWETRFIGRRSCGRRQRARSRRECDGRYHGKLDVVWRRPGVCDAFSQLEFYTDTKKWLVTFLEWYECTRLIFFPFCLNDDIHILLSFSSCSELTLFKISWNGWIKFLAKWFSEIFDLFDGIMLFWKVDSLRFVRARFSAVCRFVHAYLRVCKSKTGCHRFVSQTIRSFIFAFRAFQNSRSLENKSLFSKRFLHLGIGISWNGRKRILVPFLQK